MRSVSDPHALEYIRYVFEGGEVFRSNRRGFYRRPSGTLALQCPEKRKQLFALARR
jgi:trehalose utilization protein